MEATELLRDLDLWHEGIPTELLYKAVEMRESVTPGLIAALEEVAADPRSFSEDPGHNLYYWAVYLLAHFQEPRALGPMLKLFRLCGGEFEHVVIDFVDEDGAMLLANVAGEDVTPICELLHDKSAASVARESAADALGLLCTWSEITPARVQEEFRKALRNVSRDESILAAVIVNAATDLNLRELGADISQAFDRGVVDRDIAEFEFVAEWLHDPDFEPPPAYVHLVQSIDDIVEFFEEKVSEQIDLDDLP